LLIGVLLLGLVLVVMPRVESAAGDWAGGVPVVVEVTEVSGGEVELTEFGGGRRWTYSDDEVRRVADPVVGTSISGRLVGDCRCQLMLRPATGLPRYLALLPLLFIALSVPGLLARRRWRRLPDTLARPARPASLEPVWLRRPVGPPVWGVRVASEGRSLLLELQGTPAGWFPTDRGAVTIRGPHPANGLTTLEGTNGVAVASSAPLSERAGRSRVAPWSAQAAAVAGMVGPAPQAAIAVGGADHQRVRVTDTDPGGPPVDGLELDPTRMGRAFLGILVGFYLVWTALVVVLKPSLAVSLVLYVVAFVAIRGSRGLLARRLAGARPLAGWTDRAAATEAARALFVLGYAPARRRADEPTATGAAR
jgi:hypothetical protein